MGLEHIGDGIEVLELFSKRRRNGLTIAETAASMIILVPVLFMVLYVVIEASKAYYLKEALSQGARQAARDMAIAYASNHNLEGNKSMQDQVVFDRVRIPNVINDSAQFDEAQFNSSAIPPTVSVTVHYTGGQYGLPTFPDPDPLRLGNTFHIQGTSTYRLE